MSKKKTLKFKPGDLVYYKIFKYYYFAEVISEDEMLKYFPKLFYHSKDIYIKTIASTDESGITWRKDSLGWMPESQLRKCTKTHRLLYLK